MHSLDKVLKENINGLYYGTRVILPFVGDILKAVIDDDIIMDFSPMSEGAYYEKHEKYTEIYFFEHQNLLDDVSKFETIKLIVVDEEDDIFNFEHHRRLSLNPLENHKLEIAELDEDIIFIE